VLELKRHSSEGNSVQQERARGELNGGRAIAARASAAAAPRASLAAAGAEPRGAGCWRAVAVAGLYGLSACLTSSAAVAQGIPLIRDAEIENLLKDYSRPIFRAAGLGSHITVRIVKADNFNAFVIDGNNVYINHGTLMQAKTPNQVIGVIAHETGHIVGGHLAALRARIARDQTKAALFTILGIGAMVAGAASGRDSGRDMSNLGIGVGMGSQELLMRSILSERRSQESSADQAGMRFLEATHQSGRGMLETFEYFAQQEYISANYQDVYVRSHPVAADRIARLRELVLKSPYVDVKDPPELQLRHDLVRAKISGYLETPSAVLNRYPLRDTSLTARYARAIADNCSGKCDKAIGEVDALIREMPNNPYFWEVKGDMHYWSGKYREALAPLRKALQLAGGNEPLIQVELAQSLLGLEDRSVLEEALTLLRRAVASDPSNATAYNLMGSALARKGDAFLPQAEAATAQARFSEGNIKEAQLFARRALTKLPPGSPEWLRADDIVKYKQPKP
jgi:predicted Zn-dependent protease